jgi:large repetitive protein
VKSPYSGPRKPQEARRACSTETTTLSRYGSTPTRVSSRCKCGVGLAGGYPGSGADSAAYVFNKDAGSPGQFVAATLDGAPPSPNTPTVQFANVAGIAGYIAGSNFFAVSLMDSNSDTWRYSVLTYNWTSRQWTQQSFTPLNISYLAANGEYLVVIDSNGTATLRYLNGNLEWATAPPLSVPPLGTNPLNVALTAGPGCVAINCQSGTPPYPTYQMVIVQWDANHTPYLAYNNTFNNFYQGDSAPLLQPRVVSSRLVALNGILLRYNGAKWIENSSLALIPQPEASQTYAYAADYALQVVMDQGDANAAVLGYDPETDPSVWTAKPGTNPLPSEINPYDNFPAATDDYAVVGPTIYYRGTATNWTPLLNNPQQAIANLATLSPGFDSQSLVNEGPNFFSYATNGNNLTVQSLVLKNAQVVGNTAVSFSSQKMYTASLEGDYALGKSPQGPNLFVTYPITDGTFDTASSITLHHYAGSALTGPLIHYPVAQLAVNDQFQDISLTTYVPDPAQAACDATGMVIKYYQTTVYPGSDASAVYGKKVNTYVNGLNVHGGNYLDMLDGLLLETATYDHSGNLLKSQTNSWQVMGQVASDPRDGSAPLIRLFGGWIARTAQTKVVDGVTTSQTTSFVPPGLSAPYTGQKASVVSQSFNGSGTAETWTKSYVYGVEVNAALRALNMRSALAQGTATEQVASGSAVTVRSSASVFSMWPSSVAPGVLAPAQEASFHFLNAQSASFLYSSYVPGTVPAGWLLEQRVLQRTRRGQVIEQVDGCGIATSIIHSADLTFPVARFTNAPAGSVAYLGFEAYESTSGWTLTKTVLQNSDVRTGTTSLKMPGGASATVSVSIKPTSSVKNYAAGFWYKTLPGFQPAAGAGCTVTYGNQKYAAAFASTNGQWTFATIGIPISGSSTLTVTLTNSTAQDVLLDSVHAVPLPGSMLARTFDPVTQNYTSAMDAGGRTRWAYYDPFDRPSIQVGPNGCPKELAVSFLSRQGSASDTFQSASPNAELTLHPADGGTMETFLDGSQSQARWQPNNAGNWQAAKGILTNSSGSSATLTYKSTLPTTWALYFETTFPSGSPNVTITAGNVSVNWSGAAYTCTAAGNPVAALAVPPSGARHWLLVAGDGVMLFFADGQLLFSQPGAFTYAPPAITIGAGLGISHLAMLASPRIGVSYNDGSNRQRQVHQLYGADCRVAEKVFDALDRLVATTRVAPGSFGAGASRAPLQYRDSFVDVRQFLTNFRSTGVMAGDVALYYAGQSENGVLRSNDQGYPYHGTLWESSPRGRRIEQGLPGKPYAIANLASTSPAQRATTQYAYGGNVGSDPSLPDGKYSRTAITTPLKSSAISLQDQRGQAVATWQHDAGGATTMQSAGLRTYTQSSSGVEATMMLTMPNALLPGPQSGNSAFVRKTMADAAGRVISAIDPNTGQSKFLYDPCGRVRFGQPALDPGQKSFLYNKYDALGRLVEQGTIPQAWNSQALAAQAANRNWPDDAVSRNVTYAWSYDGDGNTASQIGQKASCVTTTAGPQKACVTTEVFTHDDFGRLVSVTMNLGGVVSASGTTSYGYNNLGELTVLTHPEGSPLKRVFYTINDQGWITGIGSAANLSGSIASYTYTADGKVETETLGGSWVRSAQYSSPGWLEHIVTKSSDGKQSLTLGCTYNADSTIASRDIAYAFAALSGSLADTYKYDGQGRLQMAQGSSDDQVTSYDPNGNIWAVKQAGNTQSFPCVAGKDQPVAVKYDARGRVLSALGKTLSYDDTTNLTIAAEADGAAVQFGYGGHKQRVLKITTGAHASHSVYFMGASQLPVSRLDGDVWSSLVYGPTGLVAIVSDQTYYPLKDNQHSVWAVVNASGLIARYVYLPFGAMVADGPNPSVTAYRFMGQEWDGELSLWNFRDRMYDPVLRRFMAPDAARQFPSPYVFCGNNPINASDPSGDSSIWALVGIGLGMAATILAGIALSIVTLGAAAPAAAAADAGIVGAEATAGTAAGTVEAGVATATEEGTVAAAEGEATSVASSASTAVQGGTSASAEVTSGAAASGADGGMAAAPDAAAESGWVSAGNYGIQVLGGAVRGAGASGMRYEIQHNRDFTVSGFFESVGWGAAGGALGAAGGGALTSGLGIKSLLAKVIIGGIAGTTSAGVTASLSNVAAHKTWDQGVLMSMGIGLGQGILFLGLGAAAKSLAAMTVEDVQSGVETMVERVVAAATSQQGTGVLAVGGFFAVGGILIGGVLGVVRSQQR